MTVWFTLNSVVFDILYVCVAAGSELFSPYLTMSVWVAHQNLFI